MIYDKLKKVVNEFISTLKEDVTAVSLIVDGTHQRRFVTYVGKEPSIECDPETEYKCVLKCYDHLLEEDIVFRMRDVKSYKIVNDETFKDIHTQYLSYIDTLNKCNNDQLVKIFENVFGFIDLPKPDKIRLFLGNYINEYITIDNNQSDWFYKTYMNIDLESATPPDHMVEMWRIAIDKSQTSAISYLETELANCETDIEKSSISDILEIVMKYNFDDEMEKNITSTRQLLQYWPSLLLPSPAFVAGESKVSTKLNPATWDTFTGV